MRLSRRGGKSLGRVGVLGVAILFGAAMVACGGGSSNESDSAAPAFDRAFIDAMVPHHEAAIQMAAAAREVGLKKTVLAGMARAIATSQQREIDQMRAWREEWYGSAVIDPAGASALGLTLEQMGMAEHRTHQITSGSDVDRAFADAMIPHHQGAITMAKLALTRAEHDQIVELSKRIITAQSAEIRVLRRFASTAGGRDSAKSSPRRE